MKAAFNAFRDLVGDFFDALEVMGRELFGDWFE